MVKNIARAGWQIIYFTAKGEVKDALREDIERGEIRYFEVEGVSF